MQGAGLPCFKRYPLKCFEFAYRASSTSIALMQVELDNLLDSPRRWVMHFDADCQRLVQTRRRGMQLQVGVLHRAVSQTEAEGVKGSALFLPIAHGAGMRLVGTQMRVDQRQLADAARPAERQLASGGRLSEQKPGYSKPALAAGMPCHQDGLRRLDCPAQVEWSPAQQNQHNRRTRGGYCLQQLQLPTRQIES